MPTLRRASLNVLVGALATMAVSAAACIVSVDGLVGGGGKDGGDAHDGTTEASCGAECGSGDATLDGGPEADGSLDVGCVPISVLEASIVDDASSCMFPDGNACAPGPASPSAIRWIPPRAPQNVCTKTQVQAYETSCFGTGSCTSFTSVAANAACLKCLASDVTDTSYGAIIQLPSSVVLPNMAGCVAEVDPCNIACAEAIEALDECALSSCTGPCSNDQSYTDFSNCLNAANSGCPCTDLSSAAFACTQQMIAANAPGAACLSPSTFVDTVTAIAAVLCSAPDAGH